MQSYNESSSLKQLCWILENDSPEEWQPEQCGTVWNSRPTMAWELESLQKKNHKNWWGDPFLKLKIMEMISRVVCKKKKNLIKTLNCCRIGGKLPKKCLFLTVHGHENWNKNSGTWLMSSFFPTFMNTLEYVEADPLSPSWPDPGKIGLNAVAFFFIFMGYLLTLWFNP